MPDITLLRKSVRPVPECNPRLVACIQRFHSHWIESTTRSYDGTACWEWQGHLNHGYGSFWFLGKSLRSHRVSHLLFVGEIPDDLKVCHRCNNKPCVNPAHLYLGTDKINMQDAMRDGLIAVGSEQTNSKLTERQVEEIRLKWATGNVRQVDLAKEFGVDQTLISLVVMNKVWKHCKPAIQPHRRIPSGRPKINYEIACEMRAMYASGKTQLDIGRHFGISPGNVAHVVRNEQWHDPNWIYVRKYNKSPLANKRWRA